MNLNITASTSDQSSPSFSVSTFGKNISITSNSHTLTITLKQFEVIKKLVELAAEEL